MKTVLFRHSRKISILCSLLIVLDAPHLVAVVPTSAATLAFNSYSKEVEARLKQQHRSSNGFLVFSAPDSQNERLRLRHGELLIEELASPATASFDGALLHHWRGTAFAPGATAADFEHLITNFNAYPQYFSPQVLQAGILSQNGSHIHAWMRIRQHHVITVVMNTGYDIALGELDIHHGYSISRSTRIEEIDSPGTRSEHALSPKLEHGFLWRQNTYWSYEEQDGGLYLQIESVSLTRSIPYGLGWAIRPYIESIPRESLQFTLRSACNVIRK